VRLAILVLLGVLSGAGCGGPGDGEPPANLLLIVVDTLRHDHVGTYGHGRPTTPYLDALAGDGVTFENAYAPSSWTLPSVVSIHTGLYPGSHRVLDPGRRLSLDARTLAETLKEAGWRTAAMVTNRLLARPLLLDQGFDVYLDSEARPAGYVSSAGVSDQAIATIAEFTVGDDPAPFFLYVHYFDPHAPYERHPGYGFSAESAGRLVGGEPVNDLREMLDTLTAEEVEFIRDCYDEEIRWTDRGIGRILAELRERGLDGNTVVVVTSDHGEEFLAHGWIGHTRTLYDEVVRVPLIVRDPRAPGRGRRLVERLVSLVAIPPTVLELLGVPGPEDAYQDVSFADAVRDAGRAGSGRAASGENAFLEVDYVPLNPRNEIRLTFKKGIVVDGFKAIRDDSTGAFEVYDLETDGNEIRNLAGARPELAAKLGESLDASIRESRSRPLDSSRIEMTPEALEQLRALGYVGQ
jgi:arylsulfatase A-like enzyme